ncbi:hypothetical protein BgiBS90_026974 [Biomphalaria glabrata]|nr:hypothetical protein BgiBS90_026974 [Biomphalaria glabrata]
MCICARYTVLLEQTDDLAIIVDVMEYPLPGPVVALLQQEKASAAPKSYFISSGKKSIKITLVYAKGEEPPEVNPCSTRDRKKTRHSSASNSSGKPASRRCRTKNLSDSSSTGNDQVSLSSDIEHPSSSPELPLHDIHHTGRERMSTVDSGHPSSSGTVGHDNYLPTESGTEEECESQSSSDGEKPRTPGREMAIPASTLGPGETPAARRDEIWQTWTRIPRTQAITRRLLPPPIDSVRRSLSPSTGPIQRNTATTSSQRRPRLHEGVSWDGSGNL